MSELIIDKITTRDGSNVGAIVVADIDELLLLNTNKEINTTAIVKDSNRGGVFIYDGAQSGVNNGGTIFNGWVRQYDGAVNVKWFGAVGDGVTNGTSAFNAAIMACRVRNKFLFIPVGRFLIEDTLFFGPLNADDISVYPVANSVMGIIGESAVDSVIVCGVGLSDKVVIDLTGLARNVAKDFKIESLSEVNAPAVGILTARFENGSSATNNDGFILNNIEMFKYFKVACRVAENTEESNEVNGQYRTDSPSCYGVFIAIADFKEEPTSGISWNDLIPNNTGSNLIRNNKSISMLHQTHTKCSYYLGANGNTNNPAMIRLYGTGGFRTESPFFNNNSQLHDCVQIYKGVAGGSDICYNTQIINPLFHQETKAGVRVVDATTSLSVIGTQTLPGIGFEDSGIVIDAYTSFSTFSNILNITINSTAETCAFKNITNEIVLKGPMLNSSSDNIETLSLEAGGIISSSNVNCKTFNQSTSRAIISSNILVKDTWNLTGDRTGTLQNCVVNYKDTKYNLNGQIDSALLGSPMNQISEVVHISSNGASCINALNRSNSPSIIAEASNTNFSSDVFLAQGPDTSVKNFNYFKGARNNNDEISITRLGKVICHLENGGVVLTSPNSTRYRIVVANDGTLSTVLD